MGWGLLVPKGWTAAFTFIGAFLAGLRFSDTVTLGSVLAAALVVVLSGIFTLRNNLKSFWRGLAEERAEQILSLQEHLDERDKRIAHMQLDSTRKMELFAEEQRAVRHDLKDQLATMVLQLEAERAKTDLSVLSKQMKEQHEEAMKSFQDGLAVQKEILNAFLRGQEGTDGT